MGAASSIENASFDRDKFNQSKAIMESGCDDNEKFAKLKHIWAEGDARATGPTMTLSMPPGAHEDQHRKSSKDLHADILADPTAPAHAVLGLSKSKQNLHAEAPPVSHTDHHRKSNGTLPAVHHDGSTEPINEAHKKSHSTLPAGQDEHKSHSSLSAVEPAADTHRKSQAKLPPIEPTVAESAHEEHKKSHSKLPTHGEAGHVHSDSCHDHADAKHSSGTTDHEAGPHPDAATSHHTDHKHAEASKPCNATTETKQDDCKPAEGRQTPVPAVMDVGGRKTPVPSAPKDDGIATGAIGPVKDHPQSESEPKRKH